MTELLAPRSPTSCVADEPTDTPRRLLTAGALIVALVGALSLTMAALATPSGATERPAPTTAVATTTPEANGPPTTVEPGADAEADAVPTTTPLVEQRPLPGDTTPDDPVDKGGSLNNILPRPNSGHAPTYQGDRGTGSQYAVLGAMLLALGVIIALVTRQSRRSKARWGAATPMAGTSGVSVAPDEAPDHPSDTPAADGPGSDAP